MRALLVLAGVLGGAEAVLGADREARAVLDKAVKAHGGAGALAKALVCTRTEKGVLASTGKDLPFTRSVTCSLPGKVRVRTDLDKGSRVVTVVNGDKGWVRSGGSTVELVKPRLAELREEAFVTYLATLAPLTKEGFTLSGLPETKVGGAPAVGVKVSAKGHADSQLYFDKRSGLLVKIARRVTAAGRPAEKEYLFSGHKEFDGVKLPTKEVQTLNGKRWSEVTVTGYKFLKKADDEAFGKP